MVEIEIIKSKISQLKNIEKLLVELLQDRAVLIYDMERVKAVQYDKPKGNVNHNAIEMNRIELSDKLEKLEGKIEENLEMLKNILRLLKEIDKENEKLIVEGVEINPSEVLICVLCKEKSNQEAIKIFGFKNKVSMYRYIDNAIEGIL